MNNPFLIKSNAEERLLRYYEKYKALYIAYDFDDTVASYPDAVPFEDVICLLKRAKQQGHHMVLFTANEGSELERKVGLCKEWGIEPDYINESPLSCGKRKPHFNILLDDHAGLSETFELLTWLLDTIDNKVKNNEDN